MKRMTLRGWILTTALTATAAIGYGAVPAGAPPPMTGPAGSLPQGAMPLANASEADAPAPAASADEAARRGELARTCNEQARTRHLMGDDRRVFMIQCMHR